jgi:hypothetical protein
MKPRNLWISCRCGWTGTDDALVGEPEHPECPRCGTTFTTYPPRVPQALSWPRKSRQSPAEAGEGT